MTREKNAACLHFLAWIIIPKSSRLCIWLVLLCAKWLESWCANEMPLNGLNLQKYLHTSLSLSLFFFPQESILALFQFTLFFFPQYHALVSMCLSSHCLTIKGTFLCIMMYIWHIYKKMPDVNIVLFFVAFIKRFVLFFLFLLSSIFPLFLHNEVTSWVCARMLGWLLT